MSVTLGDLVQQAKAALTRAGLNDAAREARLLAAHAAGIRPDRVTLALNDPVPDTAEAHLAAFLTARAVRVPLSHLTGARAFYRHDFIVTPDVLDPRPETETLVEAALNAPFDHVLDLGTGSGCILMSLLAARSAAAGVGVDASPKALDVALRNARALGVADRCLLLCGDWYDQVEGRFDLIVSNPPYITAREMEQVQPELAHEPRLALTDDGDGLSAYRVIVPGALAHLQPGGRLMVEIGWTQVPPVKSLFQAAGFSDISVFQDLDGRDRVIGGIWAKK